MYCMTNPEQERLDGWQGSPQGLLSVPKWRRISAWFRRSLRGSSERQLGVQAFGIRENARDVRSPQIVGPWLPCLLNQTVIE